MYVPGAVAMHYEQLAIGEQAQRRIVELSRNRDVHMRKRHFAAAARRSRRLGRLDLSDVGIGIFEGVAATRSFLEDWTGAYEEYEYNQVEGQDLGNGVSFVVATLGGRLAGSAGRVQERWSYTVTWAEGRITRVVVRADIDQARAAAERLAEERADA